MYQKDKIKDLSVNAIGTGDDGNVKYSVMITYAPLSTSQMNIVLIIHNGIVISGEICFKNHKKKSFWKRFNLSPDEIELHWNNIKTSGKMDVHSVDKLRINKVVHNIA